MNWVQDADLDRDLRSSSGAIADGHREILSLDICSAEYEVGWLTLFRGLTARGLSGVKLVTSDAHFHGTNPAVRETLRRCQERADFEHAVLQQVPESLFGNERDGVEGLNVMGGHEPAQCGGAPCSLAPPS